MPIQTSVSPFRTARRALLAALAPAFLLICSAGTVHAADEAASDGILSTIFSTYGIMIILVLVLVALIVFKKVNGARRKRVVASQPHRRNSRGETTPSVTTATTPREPAMGARISFGGAKPSVVQMLDVP